MMELKKLMDFDIEIKATHNEGLAVTLGCALLVYPGTHEGIDKMTLDIRAYLKNPKEHEEMFMEQFNMEQPTGDPPQPTTRPGLRCG